MFSKIGLLVTLCAVFSGSALAENISKDVELNGLKFAETANRLTNITGTGTNKTSHEINMVMIKFNLLQNGQIIGQAVDMANHVEPGQSWKISAAYNSIELKPDSFRVTEVSVH
nr:FxLYD domain-containing protein [Morganella morganii]